MKVLFEEYGHTIITFVVVIAMIVLIVALISVDGPIKTAFTDLISKFFERASSSIPSGS